MSAVVVVSPEQLAALIEAAVRRALDERPPAEPAAEWLDSAGAAALLGVSSRSVARLAKSGDLRASSVGRALRFRRADVLAYLEREREPDVPA